jgi:glycosyltransferase involved in cell wall biosynthesis
MRLAIVSTYRPTKCGIGSFTEKIVSNLPLSRDVVIIADKDVKEESEANIYRIWKKNELGAAFKIFSKIRELNCKLALIMYEYAMYGKSAKAAFFPFLLLFLRISGIKTAVLMHSIMSKESMTRDFFETYGKGLPPFVVKTALLWLTKLLALFSDKVMVFDNLQKEILTKQYGINDKKIVIVPHGCATYQTKLSQAEAKRALGYTNKKVILFHGFVKPGKGVEELLQAFTDVVKSSPKAKLIILGGEHSNLSKGYSETVSSMIKELKLENNAEYSNKYVAEEDLLKFFVAADTFVLPYKEKIAGGSGVAAKLMWFSKPMVFSDRPRFQFLRGMKGAIFTELDASSFSSAILKALEEKPDIELRKYAECNSWSVISNEIFKLLQE